VSTPDDNELGVAVEAYARAVRELREVAIDARRRIELAATAFADAREFARRRRRRAAKVTAKHAATSQPRGSAP
jgi:hypothetical protein